MLRKFAKAMGVPIEDVVVEKRKKGAPHVANSRPWFRRFWPTAAPVATRSNLGGRAVSWRLVP